MLAGEGERWLRLAARTAAQLIGPVAAGTAMGVLLAAATARASGVSNRFTAEPIDATAEIVAEVKKRLASSKERRAAQ